MAKFLRSNFSTASPGSVVFLDVQSVPGVSPPYEKRELHKLLLGSATYVRLEDGKETRRKSTVFTTEDEFWLWLVNVSQAKRPTWVFCHGMGTALTLLEFWETLHSGEWRIRDADFSEIVASRKRRDLRPWSGFYVDADPPTIISVKHISGRRAIFCDVQNYWAKPLEEIGKSVGKPASKKPESESSDSLWTEHSQHNVSIVEDAMLGLIRWVKDGDYGMFRYTASGQAMAAFRHRFKEQAINLERPSEVMQLERAGYFGGRLEMLYEGFYNGEVWELDVQAMYPSIMSDEFVPRELTDSWLGGGFFAPPPVGPGRYSLAEVLVETYNATYPLRLENCTLYPHGRYWTVLCGRELELAFQRGHVQATGRWATYRLSRIFKPFVDHFWKRRQAAIDGGNELEQQLCKTIMNSLYGKFGQLTPSWEPAGENTKGPHWGRFPELDHKTGKQFVCRYVGNYIERMVKPKDHSMSFAAISAWITAAARERMRRLVGIAGRGNCLYVVYDAVFVTKRGFQRLWDAGEIKPGKMGMLKVAGYGKDATFRGFNNYTIGSKQVTSGIKPDATPLGNWHFRQTDTQSLSDITGRKPLAGVLVGERTVTAPKTKRRWAQDGENWTIPLMIEADRPKHLLAIRNGKPFALEQL